MLRARTCAAIESLALALWIGALAGFAFVFAPVAFHTVSNGSDFARLIGSVLRRLGTIGTVCGCIALAAIAASGRASMRLRLVRGVSIAVMIALSSYVTYAVIPHMEQTAISIGAPIASLAKTDRRRVAYDSLHARSSRIYSVVLVLGAATIALAAASSPGVRTRRRGLK